MAAKLQFEILHDEETMKLKVEADLKNSSFEEMILVRLVQQQLGEMVEHLEGLIEDPSEHEQMEFSEVSVH